MFPRSSIPSATLKQRGCHMTAEDIQNNQDAARGEVARLQLENENAKERGNGLAKEYIEVANGLRQNPTNISLENYADEHLGYKALSAVIEDIKRVEKELYEAKE